MLLRLALRALALTTVAITLAPPAYAQVAPPGAAAPAEPKSRPKIGLVLSGGGARGLTHIGVLKVLREMRIPIDYIAATSMGAIVGGLFASGMSPDDMERHLGSLSWPTLLSDSSPRQDLGFRRKDEAAQFPLAFEIGYRDGEFRAFKGALSGSNLSLFLHELTRGVDNLPTFDQLPIPYRAVATNMVDGGQVVFYRGKLYQAMRASMSVPGMFAPVEIDGKLLGDGGLVNNLPVDVVRAMGAEIVIAVNIGTPLMSRDQLSSVVGYAAQMVNILTEQNVRAQLAQLRPDDILISPDLGDLTFIDFAKGPEFIALGIRAAEAARPKLAALADTPAQFAQFEQRLTATPAPYPAMLDFIIVEGTRIANPEVLEVQMETQPGKPFRMQVLEHDLARLYGRGEFEQIDYQFLTIGREQGLVINVTEKSWGPNFLRFGLALNSDLKGEAQFNIMAGHKRVWVNRYGAEWVNEVVLGSTRRYLTEFYQPLNLGNRVFAAAYGLVQRKPEYIFEGDQRVAEYDLLTETAGLDLGTPLGTLGELRGGFKWLHQRGDPTIAVQGFPTVTITETGLRLLFRWDSTDNPYFPRKGINANLEVFGGRRETTLLGTTFDEDASGRAGGFLHGAFELGKKDFVHVGARVGGVQNQRADPIADFNLGGFLQLSGLRTDQLSGSYVALGRAVYYHQIANVPLIGRGVYLGGSLEAGNVWNSRDDISAKGLVTAGSVFLAADTWLGPFYVAYGRASGGRASWYLFLGRP